MKKTIVVFLLLLALGVPVAMAQDGSSSSPSVKLISVTLLVRDYDEAAKWYSETLGFQIQDNKNNEPGKRWVTMWSPLNPSFRIILHKPGNGYLDIDKRLGADRIGKETFWILQTDDFDSVHKRLIAANAKFQSEVRPTFPGGKHVVFEDLYGNLWVLEQRYSDKSKPSSGQ